MNNSENLNNLISSLSFDQYVLIDCLKFNNSDYCIHGTRLRTLDFVATSKQGFLNIFNEIINSFVNVKKYMLKLLEDQIVFNERNTMIIIKYTDKNMTDLINLPGLDFFKCYYDGVKTHSTFEAIQCHKFKEVQYDRKISLSSLLVISLNAKTSIGDYYATNFKNNIWKNNTNFGNELELRTNLRYESYAVFDQVILFAALGLEKTEKITKEEYIKRVLNFVEEVVFKNPTSSLT
jgi:hypothetical protein